MKSDHLARLIGTMSKAEKRYFKLVTNLQKGNKRYTELFEAIERGDDLHAFAKGSRSQLPVLRNYLQQLLLKSLRNFYDESSIDIELRNVLDDIELLWDRNEYATASRILERSKKRAQEHERYAILLQLLEWQIRLDGPEAGHNEPNAVLCIYRQIDEVREAHRTILQFRELYDRSYFLTVQQGVVRDPALERAYEEIINHPLMKREATNVSFLGRIYRHLILSRCSHARGDRTSDISHSRAALELFDSHPHRILDSTTLYNRVLMFNLYNAMSEDRYDEAYRSVQRLRSLPPGRNAEYGKSIATLMEFNIYESIGAFEHSHALLDDLLAMRERERHKKSPFGSAVLDDQLARHHFAIGDYERAIEFSNKILSQKGTGSQHNLHATVRILVLMSHAELGNFSYLKYAARAAYQYLYRHNRLFGIEKALLSFFSNLSSKTPPQAYGELLKEIEALGADTYEGRVIDYRDVLHWAEAKSKGISYADRLRSTKESKKWRREFVKRFGVGEGSVAS